MIQSNCSTSAMKGSKANAKIAMEMSKTENEITRA